MAGLGRRSHYRKHLTDSVLNDLPEPSENERIAKVTGTRGSNQFELVIDPLDGELDATPKLAILPTKFRKLVWLKRNDYVICAVAEDDGPTTSSSTTSKGEEESESQDKSLSASGDIDGGIRYMIEHILYKDQVKHLKDKGLWPKDAFFLDNEQEDHYINEDENGEDGRVDEDEDEDGIVFNDVDDEYFCNMNRIAKMKIDDSSDESDEDSD